MPGLQLGYADVYKRQVSAFLTDLIGRKKNFVLFAVGSFTVVLLYTQLPVSNGAMLWLGFPLGFFASGIFSGMGSFLTCLLYTSRCV